MLQPGLTGVGIPSHTRKALSQGLLRRVLVQVPLQRVLVVYDDMDLDSGVVRLRAKGGHGGHNGMRSITQHFSGSKDFPRLRIGTWPVGTFQPCHVPP